jgi:hypothetical protein
MREIHAANIDYSPVALLLLYLSERRSYLWASVDEMVGYSHFDWP